MALGYSDGIGAFVVTWRLSQRRTLCVARIPARVVLIDEPVRDRFVIGVEQSPAIDLTRPNLVA